MRQISVPCGGAFEEHYKAVCERLAEPLGARVDSPGEIEDAGNAFGEGLEDVPDLSNFRLRALRFEFEKSDVLYLLHKQGR